MRNSTDYPEDNEEFYLIFLVFNILFLIIGILGNMAVIIYNIYLNQDKTSSSWLVANLAIADLLVCLTLYPMKILAFFLHEDLIWKIGLPACGVSSFLSTMFLLFITVDRYVFIAKPLKYPSIVISRRIKVANRCIWLVAASLLLVLVSVYMAGEKSAYSTLVLLHIFLLLTPIAIIAFLNYKILKIVREQRQRMASETGVQSEQVKLEDIQQAGPTQSSDEQERPAQEREEKSNSEHTERSSEQYIAWLHHIVKELKAVKTFAIIFAILTCCYVPYIIIMLLQLFCWHMCFSNDVLLAKHIVLELIGINSIANAFVYALRHRRYSKAFL
ncbi:alpha-1D adrenergic receptor-like [Dendronephthya gigantea]|uniref:alpha-1D adrenergic receptor-like n=1 Tax=Dendronephthya gigantea TaxID=151771 RepID=UPI00106971EF|nr:alpha-1D adrenergic receptor-like [Dendronephthya gigantea]